MQARTNAKLELMMFKNDTRVLLTPNINGQYISCLYKEINATD